MRWPRAGIVVGVIGLMLLGAGWWLAAPGSAGPQPKRAARLIGVRPPGPLLRALQQYLAQGLAPRSVFPVPGAISPRAQIAPHGTTCAVAAGGFCSLHPCVVYTGSGATTAIVSTPGAVVWKATAPGAASCHGHSAPPRTLPVAGF